MTADSAAASSWLGVLALVVLAAVVDGGRQQGDDLYKYSALAGRSIRQLPCVSRRTGEAGTCMFAIACAKANGTHLGTCIDRFYFGSCCRLPPGAVLDSLPALESNSIEDGGPPVPSTIRPPPRLPPSSTEPPPRLPPLTTRPPTRLPPLTTRPPTRLPPSSTYSTTTPSTPSLVTWTTLDAAPPSSSGVSTTSQRTPSRPSTTTTSTKPPTKPSTTRPTRPKPPQSTSPPPSKPPRPPSRPTTKPSSKPTKPSSTKPVNTRPPTRPTTPRPTTNPLRPTSTKRPLPAASKPTTTSRPTIVISTSTGGLTVTSRPVPTRPSSKPPSLSSKPPVDSNEPQESFIEHFPIDSPEPISAAAVETTTTPLPPTTQPDWVQLSVTTHEPTTLLYTEMTTPPAPTPGWPELLKPSPARPPVSPLVTPSSSTPGVTSAASPVSPHPELNEIESLNMTDFRDVCGRRLFPESRIVGGEKSTFGKWPWQVSLRQWRTSTYLHKCGAALLSDNWAITAAHCVENVPPSDLLLRLGEHDLSIEDEPYSFQERRVQIVASHPQFDPRTFEYDLALLRFYEPVKFQPNIVPVCVPEDDTNFVGTTAYVTGWGRLYEDGPLPSVLQEVSVPVINNTVCETMYRAAGYIEHIPDIFICAGWRKGGFDSCEGDSGGPMVIQRPDKRWLLAGVISWGIGCAEPNQPGVYTRISHFRHWINQILQF